MGCDVDVSILKEHSGEEIKNQSMKPFNAMLEKLLLFSGYATGKL